MTKTNKTWMATMLVFLPSFWLATAMLVLMALRP